MDIQIKDAVVETQPTPIETSPQMSTLLQMAVSKDLDTDKLEKLIELKAREDERACKKDFDIHFAEMQKQFTPIKRTKSADKSKYAPLEALVRQYGDIISDHGFSYRWREEAIPESQDKRIILVISGWGHTDDSTFFDVPYMPPLQSNTGKQVQNEIQVRGIMTTYGRRYTFKSGFGLVEEDEDTDGVTLTFEEGMKYGEWLTAFDVCATKDDLREAWKQAMEQLSQDGEGKKIVTVLRDRRYEEMKRGLVNGR